MTFSAVTPVSVYRSLRISFPSQPFPILSHNLVLTETGVSHLSSAPGLVGCRPSSSQPGDCCPILVARPCHIPTSLCANWIKDSLSLFSAPRALPRLLCFPDGFISGLCYEGIHWMEKVLADVEWGHLTPASPCVSHGQAIRAQVSILTSEWGQASWKPALTVPSSGWQSPGEMLNGLGTEDLWTGQRRMRGIEG